MTAQQMIVVDHLARLDDGSVVVAGIDGNHEHIAPLRETPWDTAATTRGGGPFGVGGTVCPGWPGQGVPGGAALPGAGRAVPPGRAAAHGARRFAAGVTRPQR